MLLAPPSPLIPAGAVKRAGAVPFGLGIALLAGSLTRAGGGVRLRVLELELELFSVFVTTLARFLASSAGLSSSGRFGPLKKLSVVIPPDLAFFRAGSAGGGAGSAGFALFLASSAGAVDDDVDLAGRPISLRRSAGTL